MPPAEVQAGRWQKMNASSSHARLASAGQDKKAALQDHWDRFVGIPRVTRQVERLRKGQTASPQPLIDKIPNLGQSAITQLHAQQPGIRRGAQAQFKALQHGIRQIGLTPEQTQQSRAIGGVIVVAG
jgi:hypothetical protein